MGLEEPGLDRHEWESEWASLEEDLPDAPREALPYVHELITRMLSERNVLDGSLVAREGADPDLIKPWEAGRELLRRLDAAEDIEDDDIREAIENYRELFETLLTERRPL
jgi:hypothetical protein